MCEVSRVTGSILERIDQHVGIREVASPLSASMLAPLEAWVKTVQFSAPLTETDQQKLASLLTDYPNVELRIYGHYREDEVNLEFLKRFPSISRFSAEVFGLTDASGLRHLPSTLQSLSLGQTKRRIVSLSILRRFPHLKKLYLEKHAHELEAISDLHELEDLTLRSITSPDLSILSGLKKLYSVDIKLGGVTDLRPLSRIATLKYLELWLIRGLTDLSAIGEITSLQYLFLQALRGVKSLPPFAKLKALRRLHLETMKGLADLEPLKEAQALQDLVICDCPQLPTTAFRCLLDLPSLRRFSVHQGSRRKENAVYEFMKLPRVKADFAFD